ncbi:SPOR domain-containing protein [Sulfitobacter aestuarii]|uniref:SPOR domain-containing protein n=1 Tax=Sulfitobacter aestuarii TaxID=2161676 RepID=A0ABW5TZN4_9RHOB
MADFRAARTTGDYEAESDYQASEYETESDFADGFENEPDLGAPAGARPLAKLTNVIGAGISVALVAGIGVWGYKLLMRDVSGIPVVRAAVGEMRVRPEEPGGQLARHQGLSVNVVAAEGVAGKPADLLKLAPKPVDLAEEDQPILASAPLEDKPEPEVEIAEVAAEESPADTQDDTPLDVAAALENGDVENLVALLTAGAIPMGEEPEEDEALAQPKVVAAVLNAPGVRHSLRPPRERPEEQAMIQPASLRSTSPARPAETAEIDAASLQVGTRLVQLGAFDSPEVAREQWDVLRGRFDDYMQDKSRVVQKATSGGRVFYRLRAHGFEDIADARRFCSALLAERADCIPVVTR